MGSLSALPAYQFVLCSIKMKLLVFVIAAIGFTAGTELESSMTAGAGAGSFRFKGFVTTTTSTSTVLTSTTIWVRSTKRCKLAGTPSCDYSPPPPVVALPAPVPNPPPTDGEPLPVPVPNPPQTSVHPTPVAQPPAEATTTVTATPLLQINLNKPPPRPQPLAVSLAQLVKPLDVTFTAGLTATKGRSSEEATVAPSAVNR